MFTIMKALLPLGICVDEYSRHAFWHHSLSRKLEDLIELKYEAAIVIDIDGMFVHGHVSQMRDIFTQCPWIDALMPVQQRRGGADIPLFTQKDDMDLIVRNLKSDERDERVAKCESGHFGLTFLRLDKLAAMKRPWFFDVPNGDGRWEDEECEAPSDDPIRMHIDAIRNLMNVQREAKIDNDIWFWKQWHRSGNNLFVARDVNIGHLQEIVTLSTARTHQDYNLDPDAFFGVCERSAGVEA
jgi:hypothetical protein